MSKQHRVAARSYFESDASLDAFVARGVREGDTEQICTTHFSVTGQPLELRGALLVIGRRQMRDAVWACSRTAPIHGRPSVPTPSGWI